MTKELKREPRKVQLGLGLPPRTLARLDRLRACTGLTRGDVVEAALSGYGLDELESVHHELLVRFGALAKRAGQNWETYAHEYARTWASKTYPPTVEVLETLEKDRTASTMPARKTLRDMV